MGGVEDSGRMRGPGRRGQEDKDEEDERTRMRRTRMIFQDSISRKMYDVDRVGKRVKDVKKKNLKILKLSRKEKKKGKNFNEFFFLLLCKVLEELYEEMVNKMEAK